MIKLCVLIDLFFPELSFPERVAAVKRCGYTAIETWQGAKPEVVASIGEACAAEGVEFVSVVLSGPGDAALAPCNPVNLDAFLDWVDRCSDAALAAGCRSGIVTSGNALPDGGGVSRRQQLDQLATALARAGELVRGKGFRLTLEPLNTAVDHKGQLLDNRDDALQVLRAVNLPNIRMLYDFYHMQIAHGNHVAFLCDNSEWIGHFHLAGVPGRHEPTRSELDCRFVISKIPDCPANYCGLEYKPTRDSADSLAECRGLC